MAKFYIYRVKHVDGHQPLSVEWAPTAEEAVEKFQSRGELAGEFVADSKCRKIHWWLY